MKKLIVALVVATLFSVRAEAVYLGTLPASQELLIYVQTATKVAMTITAITKRGNLEVEEVLVFDGSTTAELPLIRAIPRNAVRVIISVETTIDAVASIYILHGSNSALIEVRPDARITFDVG